MNIQKSRLYYADSYLTEFESHVVRQFFENGQWNIELEKTAFYPTSGGQPHDTGVLGGYTVTDVYIDSENKVIHRLDKSVDVPSPPLKPQIPVRGKIHWTRRFYHMQNHTAQHILSRCFERDLNVDTVGFHLGSEDVTIDLDTAELPWETIEKIEDKANEVIMANLPVKAQFVAENELQNLQLRHPPKVSDNIRIVTIRGFDDNPCGGTHVGTTSEIGFLKVVKSERMRRGTRLHFLAGHRAFEDYRSRFRILNNVSASLSLGYQEIPETVSNLVDSLKEARKKTETLQGRLQEEEARQYAENAKTATDGACYVCAVVPAETCGPGELRGLGTNILKQLPGENREGIVALVLNQGERIHLAIYASPQTTRNAGSIVRNALAPFHGKGGGSITVAQGSAPASQQELPYAVLKRVEEGITKQNR